MVNVGVVDYTIASPEYLKHITNFQVLEFSKLLLDVHYPIYFFIDHVIQYSCMRSSPNIMGDDNVDKNHAGGKILINVLFLENLDLELMNDLENSVINLSPENFSQAELGNCVEKLSKLQLRQLLQLRDRET